MGVAFSRDRMFTCSAEATTASCTSRRRRRVERTTASPRFRNFTRPLAVSRLRNFTGTATAAESGRDKDFTSAISPELWNFTRPLAASELRNLTRTATAAEPGRNGDFASTSAPSKIPNLTGPIITAGFASGLNDNSPKGLSLTSSAAGYGGTVLWDAYA